MPQESVRGVLLTGPVGSGKTAVAMELGELLDERAIPTAVIDLDWLGWFHAGDARAAPPPDELIVDNLRAIWPRFRSAGARRRVMARALTSAEGVQALRDALPGVDVAVGLVGASPEVIAERLGRRDSGAVLREHLEESASMARALEEAGVEDFRIDNDGASARLAAEELLRRLGWG